MYCLYPVQMRSELVFCYLYAYKSENFMSYVLLVLYFLRKSFSVTAPHRTQRYRLPWPEASGDSHSSKEVVQIEVLKLMSMSGENLRYIVKGGCHD